MSNKQGIFWNVCFHVDNRVPSIFIKTWYIIFIKNARIVQYLSQNKSADFAEGLFWELRYQQENKGYKTYLVLHLVCKILSNIIFEHLVLMIR